jgi:hypothetical protein
MSKLFISHSSRDDALVRELQQRSATFSRTCGSIRASCAAAIRFGR